MAKNKKLFSKKYRIDISDSTSKKTKIGIGIGIGIIVIAVVVIIIIAATGGFKRRTIDLDPQPIDENFSNSMLSATNDVREKYGANPVTIDEKLEEDAQNIANHLASNNKGLQHGWWNNGKFDTNQAGMPYGQNLYMMGGQVPTATDAVNSWLSECANCPSTGICNPAGNNGKVTGHFTQLVWKGCTKIGCGVARNGEGSSFVVCNYNEGNNLGTVEANIPSASIISGQCGK